MGVKLPGKVLIILVINIFLLLFADILVEFFMVQDKFQKLEQTVSIAVDTALKSSLTAEELFGDSYGNTLTSFDNLKYTSANTLVWTSDDSLMSANQYYLAQYLYNNPSKNVYNLTSTEINNLRNASNYNVYSVFRTLYGNTGTLSSSAQWAVAKRKWSRYNYATSYTAYGIGYSRNATNNNFKDFYKNIGYLKRSAVNLKERHTYTKSNGSIGTYYELITRTVPSLAQMGLTGVGLSDNDNYTASTADITNEKFQSTIKTSTDDIAGQFYMLTPYSLGVTYVPIEVFKPLVQNNLNLYARFSRLSSSGSSAVNTASVLATMKDATGCDGTNVYANGGVHADTHVNSGEYIVSDGDVEYDLSSVKVKIDYFAFDYTQAYQTDNLSKVITAVDGTENAFSYTYGGAPSLHKSSDWLTYLPTGDIFQYSAYKMAVNDSMAKYHNAYGRSSFVQNVNIYAKVTVRLRVHVLYTSPILQWVCKNYTGGAHSEHYDIKQVNPNAAGQLILEQGDEADGGGLWYEYSTYIAVTR